MVKDVLLEDSCQSQELEVSLQTKNKKKKIEQVTKALESCLHKTRVSARKETVAVKLSC